MKAHPIAVVAWALMAVLALPAAPASAMAPSSGLLAQLLNIDRAEEDAAQAGDAQAWSTTVADDFTGFDPFYATFIDGKAEAVDALKAAWANHYAPPNGARVLVRRPSFPQARRFGDIAILTYLATEAVKTPDGRIVAGENDKISKVFLKQGGRWLLVHSQDSIDRPDRTMHALHGAPRPPLSPADETLKAQLVAAEVAMEPASRHNDTKIWRSQIVDNYDEFDSYYPYVLRTPELNMAMQTVADQNASTQVHQTSLRHYRVKRYGDVALLIFAAADRGELPTSGPRTRFTFIFVKKGGAWILAHCHADWMIAASRAG